MITLEMLENRNKYMVLVSNLTGVPVDDIMSNQQTGSISQARHLTMWALVKVTHVTRGYNGKVLEKYKNKIIEYHKEGGKK